MSGSGMHGFGVAIVAVTLLARVAEATPVVELVSPGGSSSISIGAGDTFTLELRVTAGPEGLSSYGVSAEFDGEGLDAFDVLSATEHLPAGFDFNITLGPEAIEESSASVSGHVLTCEAASLGPGVANTTFVACEIEFQSTGVLGVFAMDSGLFNAGIDGLFDSDGNDVSGDATFVGATVIVTPEGGTFGLLAMGLAVLALFSRSRRFRGTGT